MPKKSDELEPTQPKNDSESKPKKPAAPKKASAKLATSMPPAESSDATVAELVQAKAEAKTGPAETVSAKPKMTPAHVKSLAIKVAAIVVAVVALIVIVFGVLIYGYKSENQVVQAVSGVVPYPVERVNGSFVSYHDYLFEIDANKRAYQNNAKLNNQPAVDYNSADGKKLVKQIKEHALEKLKSDAVVAQLAAQKKVKVTDKDVNALLDELYKRYGGKDTLMKTLGQIYGWDLGDLKQVVNKQLLAKKLEEKVTSDPALEAQAKAKAQDVLGKVKGGGDFSELAKQYSQASDASTGGDLGTVAKGQLPEEIQKAFDALQPGQVSDLVKTAYGFEIIKVLEKTGDNTHAQHIVINTIDFNDYFTGELKKAKVKTYIKV